MLIYEKYINKKCQEYLDSMTLYCINGNFRCYKKRHLLYENLKHLYDEKHQQQIQ